MECSARPLQGLCDKRFEYSFADNPFFYGPVECFIHHTILHYLNTVPIGEIYDRWIGKYERNRIDALNELKTSLREEGKRDE